MPLAALALGAGPALAEPAQYRVAIAGVTVAEMELDVQRVGAAYNVEIDVRSAGLAGAIRKIRFDGATQGVWQDGAPVPHQYEGMRNSGSGPQSVLMPYANGVPIKATFSPPRRPTKKHDLVPSSQVGTIDPATAAMLVLDKPPVGEACGRTLVIFDGIRRADLILERRVPAGGRWACFGVYRRTGGFPPKLMAEQVDFPFTIFYEEIDGRMVAQRIELDSGLGSTVVTRR